MSKLLEYRFAAQAAIKHAARLAGIDIRSAVQNPPLSDPRIFSRWVAPQDVRCLFDIGANIGQSAVAYAHAFPNATIHSFEPFPETFKRLRAVAEKYPGRVIPHQMACGSEDGSIRVANPNSRNQSNHIRAAELVGENKSSTDDSLTLQVTRLDTFCQNNGIDSIQILKTDTEGFDARVLQGAERMLGQRRITCIVSEFGLLDDQTHTPLRDLMAEMDRHKYEFAGIYEITHGRGCSFDFANALFVAR